MKWFRFFSKCWLKYLMFMLLSVVFVIPVTVVSRSIIKEQIIDNTKSRLYEGFAEIDDSLDRMELVAGILKKDDNILKLERIEGEVPLNKQVYLKYACDALRDTGDIYSFSSFIFTVFPQNDIFVSSKYCTNRMELVYGDYFNIDGEWFKSEGQLKQWLAGLENDTVFVKVENLNYVHEGIRTDIKDAILAIKKYNGDNSACIIFVLEPERIKEMLLSQNNENGFVQIYDENTKSVVLNSNIEDLSIAADYQEGTYWIDDEKYTIFTYQSEVSGLRAVTGIPEYIIDEKVSSITRIIIWYLAAGGIVTLLIAVYLSVKEFIRLKKLYIAIEPEVKGKDVKKNEYDFINNTITKIIKDKTVYEEQLAILDVKNKAIRMESTFVKGIQSEEELEGAEIAFGTIPDFYCVAVTRITGVKEEGRQYTVLAFLDYLRQTFGKHVVHVHTGMEEEIFLVPLDLKDPANPEKVCAVFEQITKRLSTEIDVSCNTGISAVGNGIKNMNFCYHQARAVMEQFFQSEVNSVRYYTVELNLARENMVDINYLVKLQGLILSAGKDEIQEYFSKIKRDYRKMPLQYEMNKQQVFFSIRHIIYHTYMMMNTSYPDRAMLPEYQEYDTFEQMVDVLCEKAEELHEDVERKNQEKKMNLKKSIVNYMNAHLSDPDLSTAVIKDEYGVSERYANMAVKEVTGMTFGGYREKIRIDKAKEFLINTDMTNEEIAIACGFSALNTFYKVFGKLAGCSPKVYKEKTAEKEIEI